MIALFSLAYWMRIPEPPGNDDEYKIFQNRIDHFNTHDSTTYNERFVENLTFVNKTFKKALLYIGGEATLSPRYVQAGSYLELAARENAAVFALEHRFFGQSMPFNQLTSENYKYLTIEQALADLAEFIEKYIYTHPQADKDGVTLAVVGGSYPGALSSWFRLKYPHLAVASWASSAPVNVKNDFPEYDEYVAKQVNLSAEGCLERTRKVFDISHEAVKSGDASKIAAFKDKYGIKHETNDISALYIIADVLSAMVQYNSRYGVLDQYCAKLTASQSESEYENIYIQTFKDFLKNNGQEPEDYDLLQATSTDPSSATANSRSWSYMTCNEVGWFQTASGKLRSSLLNMDYFTTVCQNLFGINLADSNQVNYKFGNINPGQTQVYFSNGDVDPWSTLGVETASPNIQRYAVVIPGESHCADLGKYNASLESNLTISQAKIINQMQKWMNVRNDCVNGISIDGECACKQGWTGETCEEVAAFKSSVDLAIIVGISVPVVVVVVIIFASWIFVYIPKKKQAMLLYSHAENA